MLLLVKRMGLLPSPAVKEGLAGRLEEPPSPAGNSGYSYSQGYSTPPRCVSWHSNFCTGLKPRRCLLITS